MYCSMTQWTWTTASSAMAASGAACSMLKENRAQSEASCGCTEPDKIHVVHAKLLLSLPCYAMPPRAGAKSQKQMQQMCSYREDV